MEYEINAISKVKLDYKVGETTSTYISSEVGFVCSDNVRESFIDKDDKPTIDGVKAVTQAFIQGLIGNIELAEEMDCWDSDKHLKYIISEINRGFKTLKISPEFKMKK